MHDLTWIEFQTALLTYESRIEQLNALQTLSINPTANLTQGQKDQNSSYDTKNTN